MATLMMCGHTAQAKTVEGQEVCAICYGIKAEAAIPAPPTELTGRKAKCCYCNAIVDSNVDLPFFAYRPNREYDEHYNGCRGWD